MPMAVEGENRVPTEFGAAHAPVSEVTERALVLYKGVSQTPLTLPVQINLTARSNSKGIFTMDKGVREGTCLPLCGR